MRNRYVKKCKCDTNPVVIKKTATLRKAVLDIEITVSCPECGRLYKEAVAKKIRMDNPDILVETVGDELSLDQDTGVEDESNGAGELQQETESPEGDREKEKSPDIATKEEVKKTEPEDQKRDADESSEKDPVEEEKKPRRGRSPGKAAGDKDVSAPVYEKTTKEALSDDGIPKEDLF